MSIKYDSRREPLAEIIKRATQNATYVVPDLQRPYVWTPRQVTLLVDSLFRGWPFGSLLLWEVKPDCFDGNEGIPHRAFWQVVDRTSENEGSSTSMMGRPATYRMVLDGQQRVQSLILALGGDRWGFRLYDADWAMDLQGRRTRGNHWSAGGLCVDLEKFAAEVDAKGGKVRKLEVGAILEWVVLDGQDGQSSGPRPPNYVHPLMISTEHPGRFVRLSRLWDLAEQGLSESEYQELLEPMLQEHRVSAPVRDKLTRPLAQFLQVVENVKNNSFVHALQIESFRLTPQWSKDDYSDAIVNIFTRLNTAGRTLTREEITLAWLKVGWIPADTGGRTAGQCLEDLRGALTDRGFELETDEIVRLVSFVWAVEERGGGLLDSKDLLRGDVVRSLATSTARNWDRLKPDLERGADVIHARDLPVKSFNAVIVALSWCRIVFGRLDGLTGLSCIERDDLEKHLRTRTERFVDRLCLGGEWAGVWGDAAVQTFQNFAADLHSIHALLKSCTAANFLNVIDEGITKLMGRIATKATEHVELFVVKDRRRVHDYYSLLWVWHRLDQERWKSSSVPMRIGRKRVGKLEVDHTIADAWWQRRTTEEVGAKLEAYTGSEDERHLVAPDGFESRPEAQAYVNQIGNCSLLDKSFNVSKSDKPMWDFLQLVHEFKENKFSRQDWQSALLLSDAMTAPDGKVLAELKSLIQARDAAIRKELAEFLAGIRARVDL